MLVIGHRGAAGHQPENTLGAMRKALELGVDGVEFDVRCHGDHVVVLHDATLERTTDGHGDYRALDFAALRALRAANGEGIPTLEEVLAVVSGCAHINVELKDAAGADRVVDALERWFADAPEALGRVLLSAFDTAATARLAARRGRMRLGVLYRDEPFENALARACALDASSLHLSLDAVDATRVMQAHDASLAVYVYTVNAVDDIAHCQACGVDGVFSDFPDRVVACNRSRATSEVSP
ncbi:MAG: glycerophosphodiester phosphodiesterase family protein [Gammaproteobacteria bacterium]